MPEVFQSQVFLTVLSGVLVFILGQVFINFLVKPYLHYRAVGGEIIEMLIFYADVFPTPTLPIEESTRARENIRKLSGKLLASANEISWFWFWRIFGRMPDRDAIAGVAGKLIGISNATQNPAITATPEWRSEIGKLLKIKFNL